MASDVNVIVYLCTPSVSTHSFIILDLVMQRLYATRGVTADGNVIPGCARSFVLTAKQFRKFKTLVIVALVIRGAVSRDGARRCADPKKTSKRTFHVSCCTPGVLFHYWYAQSSQTPPLNSRFLLHLLVSAQTEQLRTIIFCSIGARAVPLRK